MSSNQKSTENLTIHPQKETFLCLNWHQQYKYLRKHIKRNSRMHKAFLNIKQSQFRPHLILKNTKTAKIQERTFHLEWRPSQRI